MRLFAYVLILILSCRSLSAQVYNIGDRIKTFSLINASDNNKVSLNDFLSNNKAVAIIFTSQDCPYSKLYEERIIRLASEFESRGVKFLLINPNNPNLSPSDAAASLTKYVVDKKIGLPYLIDNKQEVANAFGASKTPEVFLLKNINGAFVLQYKGAIDDNPQVANDVKINYVREALNAILTNATIKINDRRATGCMIKK
ncbi:MAG: thioredoxin family protein [Cytophagaceae bacterium]